ncbi:MAG: DUF1232 domain-containing protein [Armatimonadetes bacterium]|nr:DUF1232 domain-containing protein [Armatimonadota bacterium]
MRHTIRELAGTLKRRAEAWRAWAADPRTPRSSRWLVGLAVGYALMPFDLIPDWIPLVGHLDDLVIVPLLLWLALRRVPAEVRAEHLGTPGQAR